MQVYYHGCWKGPGHFLYAPSGRTVWSVDLPWEDAKLDATLCPGYERYMRTEAQIQGAAKLHHKNGWTALAFWDRSGDSRDNSNSVFIAEGEHTAFEMMTIGKSAFPQVWERFKFQIEVT